MSISPRSTAAWDYTVCIACPREKDIRTARGYLWRQGPSLPEPTWLQWTMHLRARVALAEPSSRTHTRLVFDNESPRQPVAERRSRRPGRCQTLDLDTELSTAHSSSKRSRVWPTGVKYKRYYGLWRNLSYCPRQQGMRGRTSRSDWRARSPSEIAGSVRHPVLSSLIFCSQPLCSLQVRSTDDAFASPSPSSKNFIPSAAPDTSSGRQGECDHGGDNVRQSSIRRIKLLL